MPFPSDCRSVRAGLGAATQRETIVNAIKHAAVRSTKVDVAVVPSRPGNTPVQAHSFVDNEAHVVDLTAAWLRDVVA
ncbi:MAG: hypothetical protein K2Y27_03130 [Xanthobacteraceae bacterium]|nr:hypothetical protein [Xanthobacteraceae bacterium]